jgi:beta-galactosidase
VTASAPAALRLTPDQSVIKADTGSIAYVDIEIQDKTGVLVKHGEPDISVEVAGAGELLAVGTGNPISEEMYVGNHRKAFQGHLLAVVRSTGQPGEITLTAKTEGLPPAQVKIQTK